MDSARAVTAPLLGFLTWSSPVPTGGNVYDDRLTESLRDLGVEVQRHRVGGTWPADSERYRDQVAPALEGDRRWLVDSIVACAVPDLVLAAHDRGRPWTILLHSLLSTEIGLSAAERDRYRNLEAVALRAARRVIVTSQWAADDLRHRHPEVDVVVAQPGVLPAPLTAASDTGDRLLSLASMTPTKNQLSLIEALGRLTELRWSVRLVGGDRVAADYTATVRAAVAAGGLVSRVQMTGPLSGADLEQVWATTDLLVVTSLSETYGMVVVEALSRGVPAVVSAGTGAVEALGQVAGERPGAAIPPGQPDVLAQVLRDWLTDSDLRCRWRATALLRRDSLAVTTWADCARTVRTAMSQ
jgi:glycosyltransferase involved in cell wall biosynthesis